MSVWFCIPSKKPASECNAVLNLWRNQGYRTAVFRDEGDGPVESDIVLTGKYEGYAATVNGMCCAILSHIDPSCEWIVTGGDDTEPDPNHTADEIAAQLTEHFGGTFGVCQPTGDDWTDGLGRVIERVAGSPWLGREWCERANNGNGPLWPQYTHCFVDDELQHVAIKYGAFLQRADLIHYHRHWVREKRSMPGYLVKANSPAHWHQFQSLFRNRKSSGFPGSEPLAKS